MAGCGVGLSHLLVWSIPDSRVRNRCYLVQTGQLFSQGDACAHGSVRLFLLQGQAVEEPLQLTPTDRFGGLVRALGPTETSSLQASVVEPEAIMIPVEDLEFVAVSIAEDEEAAAEEIVLEDLADKGSQAVDGLSQIGVAAGEEDLGWLDAAQHGGAASAATTARKRTGSKSGATSMAAPAIRMVTPPGGAGIGAVSTMSMARKLGFADGWELEVARRRRQ